MTRQWHNPCLDFNPPPSRPPIPLNRRRRRACGICGNLVFFSEISKNLWGRFLPPQVRQIPQANTGIHFEE